MSRRSVAAARWALLLLLCFIGSSMAALVRIDVPSFATCAQVTRVNASYDPSSQVARSLVYPTDTCFSRALGQSEKIVCATNSASTTAQWTYYSDASCTTVSATPAVSLTVSGACQDSALGAPIYADCTSAGAMPALFAGAGIFQLLPPFFAGGQSYSDVCPASAVVGAGDLRTWAPTLFTASVTAASKSATCDAALNRTGVVVTCSRCFGFAQLQTCSDGITYQTPRTSACQSNNQSYVTSSGARLVTPIATAYQSTCPTVQCPLPSSAPSSPSPLRMMTLVSIGLILVFATVSSF